MYSKSGDVLIAYPAGREVESYVVPDGDATIGGGAFSDCSSLNSISLPTSVKEIGLLAFEGFGRDSLSVAEPDREDGARDLPIVAELGSYAAQWAAENDVRCEAPSER